jgi:hypothetical protein
VATCERWSRGASAERQWILRHALRSAVKRGEPGALAVLGYKDVAKLEVKGSFTPCVPRLGETVKVTLHVTNRSAQRQRAVVDLRVHFMKANGSTRPKVFKVREVDLAASASTVLEKTVSLKVLSTRRHYPGTHRVEALVNGKATPVGAFTASPTPVATRQAPSPSGRGVG